MKELTYELKLNRGVNYDNTLYKYYVNSAATKDTQPEYITCNVARISPENTHRVFKDRRGILKFKVGL